MYEDDRQTALAMYNRMFDETADEQGLLQLLVSPTRQAVVLARSYDAKERKLQIESQSRDEDYQADPENVPAFVFIIDKTAQQAAELGVRTDTVAEGQFSIFDLDEPDAAEEASETFEDLPELEETPAAEGPVEKAEEEPDAEAEETEESRSVEETADALDAFLADFTIENGELVSVKAEEPEPETEAVETEEAAEPEEIPEAPAEEAPQRCRQKTNIFLLVLYIFLAIPVGLVGLGVLLLPTVLFLALAALCVCLGVNVIGMCFGSFTVIADTMVVFGAGLGFVALSLLFVWLFIWFLGGVIVGFIRGICSLGRKICCKEVAVQ